MLRGIFSSTAVLVALLAGSLWVAARYFAPVAGGSVELVRMLDAAPQLLFMIYLPMMAINLFRYLNGLPGIFGSFMFYIGSAIGGLNLGGAAYALIMLAVFGTALQPIDFIYDVMIGFIFVGFAYMEEQSKPF